MVARRKLGAGHEPDMVVACATYARYSSDDQKRTSIDDQVRNCKDKALEEEWQFLADFVRSDRGISGAALATREGLSSLIADARRDPKPFNCILIDDTSRLGRNLSDVLRVADVLRFHGVFLYFVTQDLDSRDPSFRMRLIMYGMQDEDFLVGLRHRVHRGMKGAALAGHHTGGTRYGYDRILVNDPTRKDEHGRVAIDHAELKPNPEQSKIVNQIYGLRAIETSITEITKGLNSDSIPGPRGRGWSYTAVRNIMNDSIYIGINTWNRTMNVLNPDTGRTVSKKRQRSEWIVKEQPTLRIVSDELWNKVQAVNKKRSTIRQQLGGTNRTQNSRTNLFTRLKCGVCFGSMSIIGGRKGTSRRVRYGCRAHRYEGKCENNHTIRVDVLEEQLLGALIRKLRPEVLEEQLNLLRGEIERYLENEADTGSVDETTLSSRFTELKKEQSNVTRAISSYGPSDALFEELSRIENELKKITSQLAQLTDQSACEVSFEEFKAFVLEKASDLESVLRGDPVLAKQAINGIIQRLVLTPVETAHGILFEVTGDVDLFAGEDCVLLNAAVDRTNKHYTQLLSLTGLRLDPRKPVQSNDLAAQGSQVPPRLLNAEPPPFQVDGA